MYEDKTLVCKECGQEFVFTAGEQEFYAERGFMNEPQRCKPCRDARKNANRAPREYFTATCAACGGEAKVPFCRRLSRSVRLCENEQGRALCAPPHNWEHMMRVRRSRGIALCCLNFLMRLCA